MKSFQRVFSIFVFSLLLIGVFTLGGCQLEKVDVVDPTFTQQLLSAKSVDEIAKISTIKDQLILEEVEFLKEKERITYEQYVQFHSSGVNFATIDGIEYYPLDGKAKNISNYLPTREYIQQEMESLKINKSARHRRYQNMFIGGNIKIRIHQNVPLEWKNAVSEAVAAWNSLGVNLSLSVYTATNNNLVDNEIDIRWTSLSSMAYVFPNTQFKYSEYIIISTENAKVEDTNATGRKVIMVHELGHVTGLLHTDTMDGQAVSSLTGCSGSVTDSRSIMRQYVGKTSPWEGFTTCDWNVINYYWGSIV